MVSSAQEHQPSRHGADAVRAHGTTVDALVRQIRALMRDRKLGVGDHLPTERELGLRFAASRNTVREALRTLKAYGLIEVRPKVGAVIIDRSLEAAFDLFAFNMEVSRETFTDVQAFRRLIEVGIGEQIIADALEPDLARADGINAAMRDASSVMQSAEQDYAFHQHLVGLVRNRTLTDIYRFLKPVILRLMLLGKARRPAVAGTFDEHAAIVAALRRRDRVAFSYLMSRHLESGARFVREPEPGAAPAVAWQRRKQK